MAKIALEELASMAIGVHSIEELKRLSFYKDKIDAITSKYLLGNENYYPEAYDLPDEMSKDAVAVATYLASMATLIGNLKGLLTKLEEDKKLIMAIKYNKTQEGSNKDRENDSRAQSETVIKAYSRAAVAEKTYGNYQFVISNWIESIEKRVSLLSKEAGRMGRT